MSLKTTNIIAVIVLIILSLSIFANSMTKPLGRDEHVYCTAGYLLTDGKLIYKDFSYITHLPYHPLFCAALFRTFNTTHYLLTARLLSVFCDILVLICIVGIYRHIFSPSSISGIILGLMAALLFIFNPFVDYAIGFAWNHDVVVLCIMLSFWLFIAIDFNKKPNFWRIGLIGALLTIATWTRPTTLLVQLIFFFMLLMQPTESLKEKFKRIVPFLIASFIFSIWPLSVIIQAPSAFLIDVFKIPALNSEFLHEIGMVLNKGRLTLSAITTPAYFLLIAMTVYSTVYSIFRGKNLSILKNRRAILAFLIAACFILITYIPPAMWIQYLAIPVPFIIISLAYPMLCIKKASSNSRHYSVVSYIMFCSSVIAVLGSEQVLKRTLNSFEPQKWVPITVHKISEDICKKTEEPKLVLTLSPLYAIEGGCKIYTELSAGPFAYRVADRLSSSEKKITHTISTADLESLVKKSPPCAIIIGTEPKFLEEPIIKSALSSNWQKQTYGDSGPIAYFKR